MYRDVKRYSAFFTGLSPEEYDCLQARLGLWIFDNVTVFAVLSGYKLTQRF